MNEKLQAENETLHRKTKSGFEAPSSCAAADDSSEAHPVAILDAEHTKDQFLRSKQRALDIADLQVPQHEVSWKEAVIKAQVEAEKIIQEGRFPSRTWARTWAT